MLILLPYRIVSNFVFYWYLIWNFCTQNIRSDFFWIQRNKLNSNFASSFQRMWKNFIQIINDNFSFNILIFDFFLQFKLVIYFYLIATIVLKWWMKWSEWLILVPSMCKRLFFYCLSLSHSHSLFLSLNLSSF